MSNLTRIQSDMIVDPTTGSKVSDQIAYLTGSGTTANRPTTNLYVGRPYYDTTLGKPVWCHQISPIVWHDATGASV